MSADSWIRPVLSGSSEQGIHRTLYGEIKHGRGLSTGNIVDSGLRKDSQDSWVNPSVEKDMAMQEESSPADALRQTDSRHTTQNADYVSSPSIARPHTAGSSVRSGHPSSHTAFNRGLHPDSNTTKSPQIIYMGPSLKEPLASPSKFPSESHRPPPRPPQSSSHNFSSVPKLGPAPKPSKNKLNLLYPMSLFLKRRSGPGVETVADESLASYRTPGTVSALPDDFDPSIRGKVVHDFSVPREKRTASAGAVRIGNGFQYKPGYNPSPVLGREEPGVGYSTEYRPDKEHMPVFKEHFDDGMFPQSSESAVRAEQLANRDFISRNSGPPIPPFAPLPPPKNQSPSEQNDRDYHVQYSPTLSPELELPPSLSGMAAAQLPPVVEDENRSTKVAVKRQSAVNRRTTTSTNRGRHRRISAGSRASRVSRSSIGSDTSPSGLPSHMSSRASRFSFQLVGKDSAAQERMLEERHKEREAARQLAQKSTQAEEDISEEDEYDFDDMDGLEEDVPMVGDDWDYGMGGGLSDISTQMPNITAPNLAMLALRGNPVNMNNFAIPALSVHGLGIIPATSDEDLQLPIGEQDASVSREMPVQHMPERGSFLSDFDEDADDLYFDDGLIDEANFDDTEKFDESVLDDPNHPLYERKPPVPMAPHLQSIAEEDNEVKNGNMLVPQSSVCDTTTRTVLNFTNYPNPNTSPEQLASYHDILAAATTKAAQLGRFERKANTDGMFADDTNIQNEGDLKESPTHPSLIPDESRTSQATTISPILGISQESPQLFSDNITKDQRTGNVLFTLPTDDYNDFNDNYLPYNSDLADYDGAFDEDQFIAAANADALANDFDGEYGSEFGFYARPASDSSDGAVFANGGYFGPKEWSEIKRQRSTREPNLTPITERSEYSTRNSFVSLQAAAQQQMSPGPGLAQLARLSPGGWDADANFEALMKLRRGAFGGSQTSLGSLGSAGVPSSPLASSPIMAKVAEPRFYGIPQMMPVEEMQVPIAEIPEDDEGEWEDASSQGGMDELDEDYTDTSDVEDDFPDDTSESPTVMAQTYTPMQAQQGNSLTRSFSQPFSKPDIVTPDPLLSSREHPYDIAAESDLPSLPQTQDTSTTATANSTSSTASTLINTAPDLPPPPTTASLPKLSEPPVPTMKPRPTPLQNLLSPHAFFDHQRDQKAASGTFYSPASSLAVSPTKSSLHSPTTAAATRGHSRSGSDSVTYVREAIGADGKVREVGGGAGGRGAGGGDDGGGSGSEGEMIGAMKGYRWVVERRRTGEDGVEEVVGREVVSGGAI